MLFRSRSQEIIDLIVFCEVVNNSGLGSAGRQTIVAEVASAAHKRTARISEFSYRHFTVDLEV